MRLQHYHVAIDNVKEMYIGQDRVFGFRSEPQYLIDFQSTDDRVWASGISNTGVGDRGNVYDVGAFLKVNAPCCKFSMTSPNTINPGSTSDGLDIYLKNFFTGETLYRYRLFCESYSSSSNFTMRSNLYDGNNNLLSYGRWVTDYGFNSLGHIQYDFDDGQFIFDLLDSEGSHHGGGFIKSYAIQRSYVPFKVEVYNASNKVVKYLSVFDLEVQD